MGFFSWIKTSKAEKHFELAKNLSNKGLFPEAVKEYREAIRLDPDNEQAYVNLAASLTLCGLHQEAKKVEGELYMVSLVHGDRSSILHPDLSYFQENESISQNIPLKKEGSNVVFKKSCPSCGNVQFSEDRTDARCNKCGNIGRIIAINRDEIAEYKK